jgi:glycosyltransferase involved in cell wall biosynthesis
MGHVAHEYAGRLRERGHTVEVFTPSMAGGEIDTPEVHRLRSVMRIGNAAFVPSLYRRLAAFDLVHLHLPFFGGAEPVLLRRWTEGAPPLLVTYHMDATASGLRHAIFRAHQRLVLPRLLKTAARVLVSSMDYAEHSALADIDGVLARVEVHPFGVDLERFHPGAASGLRTSFTIASNEVVLLFVARLDAAHHFKGLGLLIEALRQVRHDRWRLMVVGDGPMRPAFEARVASVNLTPRVFFAGDVEPADLPAYYRMADMHVFPSTGRSEAFGLVCLEAAASGIPPWPPIFRVFAGLWSMAKRV